MNWRCTFRRLDDIGIADYVVDIEGPDSAYAHEQALHRLKAAIQGDWQRYSFRSAIKIERKVPT